MRERARLREEAGFHLERLTNAYLLEGMLPPQAAQHAIDIYGSAPEVAQQFLDAWYAHHPPGKMARRIGLGIITASIWFGGATLLVTTLAQYRIYRPEMGPLVPGDPLASLRQLVPTSLSYIETNALFFVLWE